MQRHRPTEYGFSSESQHIPVNAPANVPANVPANAPASNKKASQRERLRSPAARKAAGAWRSQRTPCGWWISRLLGGRDTARAIATRALGEEWGGRLLEVGQRCVWETATRERRASTRYAPRDQRVEYRERGEERDEIGRSVRRCVALYLMVGERIRIAADGSGQACGAQLYLPTLAARLGVTVRTVERYLAGLQAAGLVRAWQPQEGCRNSPNPRAPRGLPASMRGEIYAYQIYRIDVVPAELRGALDRYYGGARERERAADASVMSELVAELDEHGDEHGDEPAAPPRAESRVSAPSRTATAEDRVRAQVAERGMSSSVGFFSRLIPDSS